MKKEIKRQALETFIKYAIHIAIHDWKEYGPYKDHVWGESSVDEEIIEKMIDNSDSESNWDEYSDAQDEVKDFIENELFGKIEWKSLDVISKLYKGEIDE